MELGTMYLGRIKDTLFKFCASWYLWFYPKVGGEMRYDYRYLKRSKPRVHRSCDETHPGMNVKP